MPRERLVRGQCELGVMWLSLKCLPVDTPQRNAGQEHLGLCISLPGVPREAFPG